ncbi:hypothetical protein MTR67_018000 [Solanum verrucosum]|uniref:Uncharacterized protein n=1 Tax=Solanum verrucosum TaxID=315347 RepID=A0AAF0QNZ4_SOLVR|nr:hypothetical protein MTR67_018000 [Solanum verrucosum]
MPNKSKRKISRKWQKSPTGKEPVMVTLLILGPMDMNVLNYGKCFLVKVLLMHLLLSSTNIGCLILSYKEVVVMDILFPLAKGEGLQLQARKGKDGNKSHPSGPGPGAPYENRLYAPQTRQDREQFLDVLTIDWSTARGSWFWFKACNLRASVLIHGPKPRSVDPSKGPEHRLTLVLRVANTIFYQGYWRESVAGASSSAPIVEIPPVVRDYMSTTDGAIRVAESTIEGAMMDDVGITEGDQSIVLAVFGKPDPPAC